MSVIKMDLTTIFKFAADYGIFPVLFILSFIHIIVESKNREAAQKALYDALLQRVDDLETSVESIKSSISRIDTNMSTLAQKIDEVSQDTSSDSVEIKHKIELLDAWLRSN